MESLHKAGLILIEKKVYYPGTLRSNFIGQILTASSLGFSAVKERMESAGGKNLFFIAINIIRMCHVT